MDTLRGVLRYSPNERSPIQIFSNSRTYDLWPLLAPTFWSLCGLYVEHDTKSKLSYSIALSKERNWKLQYESRTKTNLCKPGQSERFDVAAHLDSLLASLHNRLVTVEANGEHFKISADTGNT